MYERIWKRTLDRFSHTENGQIINHKLLPFYPAATDKKYETCVQVKNIDCVEAAIELPGSLLLNMANESVPGGWPNLVGAQEEDLFRRSNLHKFLMTEYYPIKDNQALISKNVQVYSTGLRDGYKVLDQPQYIDIVSCPAVKNSMPGVEMSVVDSKRFEKKIHTLFQAALKHGYKDLVLSAWGCGGFRCPPEHVSKLIKKILINYYDGCFEKIVFAIFNDNFPKSNFNVFQQTFS